MLGPQCPDKLNYPQLMVFSSSCSEHHNLTVTGLINICRLRCRAPMYYRNKQLGLLSGAIHHIQCLICFRKPNGTNGRLCPVVDGANMFTVGMLATLL